MGEEAMRQNAYILFYQTSSEEEDSDDLDMDDEQAQSEGVRKARKGDLAKSSESSSRDSKKPGKKYFACLKYKKYYLISF
jgi:hypothetical protein